MADRVAIAWVHGDAGRVSSFEDSRDALRDWDNDNNRYIKRFFKVRSGAMGLELARNNIAAQLIASDCDWVLMIDTDMGFHANALDMLMAVADPQTRPIVGGLCFAPRIYATDGMNGFWSRPSPTLFGWHPIDDDREAGFVLEPMYPVNGIVQVSATGTAFLLIHRSVFERIAELEYEGRDGSIQKMGPTWFDRTPDPNGQLAGEDVSFCIRANLAGIPIFVHCGVKTSHYKSYWLQEKDHWRAYNPPPATDETAVIVPIMKRPQNAAPFMASLRASTGLAKVYAVADHDDTATIQAWAEAGAEVIVGDVVTFARKVNLGYSKTSEPWLFVTGDDVRFHPGWLDHAQHVASVFDAGVVGTNDLGNARVMNGEHSGHLLVRRSYVDEVGSSWDGPGVVCHEGYGHNFVDDEIVLAAKRRGLWQMALGSVVEHMHPLFGKSDGDETYERGQSTYEEDGQLYAERAEANR